jgi:hypothetical protein
MIMKLKEETRAQGATKPVEKNSFKMFDIIELYNSFRDWLSCWMCLVH